MVRGIAIVLIAWGLAVPAMAGPEGRVRVVDADTLDVGGTRVRLFGIDAPELDQGCRRPDGTLWACGAWARDMAEANFGGRQARCDQVDRDRYGRSVAICTVRGRDIARTLVRAGAARAYTRYSQRYLEDEKEALVDGVGIYGSEMLSPEAHRAARAAQPAPPPPGRCAIKGNISSNGRIYHVPGQEHYANTRINTARGERWFCTEAEARAAGWRRARR